jgi:hypothetical protein
MKPFQRLAEVLVLSGLNPEQAEEVKQDFDLFTLEGADEIEQEFLQLWEQQQTEASLVEKLKTIIDNSSNMRWYAMTALGWIGEPDDASWAIEYRDGLVDKGDDSYEFRVVICESAANNICQRFNRLFLV